MQLSDVFLQLGEERLRQLVKGISIGTLRTYQLYDRFKTRTHLPKVNTENLRKAIPKFWQRLNDRDDEFATDLEKLTAAIQSRTAANEPIWVFPSEALLYFLADRPQPTRFPLAIFAVTRDQRHELIAELQHTEPRWAVVYPDAPLHDRVPYSEAMPEVVEYLQKNYELDNRVGAFLLLRRKPGG